MVVDLGSMWTRIGMTNEQQPKTIERTMKGRIRKTIYQNSNDQYILYGNDVSSKSGIFFLIPPIFQAIQKIMAKKHLLRDTRDTLTLHAVLK